MPTPAHLFITGATGNVGGAALRCLLTQRPAGAELTAATREPVNDRQGVGMSAAAEVNLVPFDFTKPETVAPALRGVTGLLPVRPPAIGDVTRYLKPVVQAAAAGVSHIVFLSLQGAQYNPFVPHHRVEGYLKYSGIRYSLLRPSFFMQNLNTTHRDDIRRHNQLLLSAGHASFVDAADVGAAAAQLLLNLPAASAGYELTGRDALTYDEVAAQLSAVLGRPKAGIRAFRAYECAKGTPPALVNVMTGIYSAARLGLAAHVLPVLAELLGREPGTLRAFRERERVCRLP